MAKLIVKSPYIKYTGKKSVSGYMNYIATRENVEKLNDDRPPTRKQEQLIAKLAKDFPDTKKYPEYKTYADSKTKVNASAFISSALEMHWKDVSQSEVYMKYIATRPRAEHLSSHGLFGDEDNVDLERAMSEIENYEGNIWTHIISLKREDAERLGYDNAKTWRNLIRTHRNEIAEQMHIPPENFRWYAAFHNEGDHPHIHMMAWSTVPKQAHLDKDGIKKIKSVLTNDIFRFELDHLYEQKTEYRDELVQEVRKSMAEYMQRMQTQFVDAPSIGTQLEQLSDELKKVNGKKVYGYLPKHTKELVNQIIDDMSRLRSIDGWYDKWWQMQCSDSDYYAEQVRERPTLSQQKEFRQIKNVVIKTALQLQTGRMSFVGEEPKQEDIDYWKASNYYLELHGIIFDDNEPMEDHDYAVDELKALAKDGDVHAQYLMGKLYRDGPQVIPDSVEARDWFTEAAIQDFVPAQIELAKLLLSQDNDVRNVQQGIKVMKIAAINGSAEAEYLLGKEYYTGKNVGRDVSKAIEHWTKAADNGNANAQLMLGKLCREGSEVVHNEKLADTYLNNAASNGNFFAGFLQRPAYNDTKPSVVSAITTMMHLMSGVFQSNSLPVHVPMKPQIDKKRWREQQKRRIALGHREDDHEVSGWEQEYTM